MLSKSFMPCALQYSEGKQGVKKFQETLEPLRKTVSEYAFLGGKTKPSYADIVVFGFFMVCVPPQSLYHLTSARAMLNHQCCASALKRI